MTKLKQFNEIRYIHCKQPNMTTQSWFIIPSFETDQQHSKQRSASEEK